MAEDNEAAAGSAPSNDEGSGGEAQQIERGTYEIIRDRLKAQAAELGSKAQALNAERIETFGGTEMAVIANERIRTEHNCTPRDIAQAGDTMLFGYNVLIGLKKQTAVQDVFSSYQFAEDPNDGTVSFNQVTAPFLEDERFQKEFRELYEYYKSTRLLQLRNIDDQILAVFQTGATVHDFKVLRWVKQNDASIVYRDNRGERDHIFSTSHDFEWTATTREDHVQGQHPHVDILGKVFIETVGGDLTVKIENNTEDGLGIYREDVEDRDQALDDAEVHYAELGSLILIKVLPYNEIVWRYLVFNTRTHQVDRIDAIGLACQQLPEDHGIIFPGGYYLQNGETKNFDEKIDDLEFVKRVRSPNGEDVLYIFHHREDGTSLLLPYNMIRKQVDTIVACHGYSLFQSGKMVIFKSTSEEATRVHSMQVWQTPFMTEEFAARATSESADTFLEKIGNADLVRGVSDAFSLQRDIEGQSASIVIYQDLISSASRLLDSYHWLDKAEAGSLSSTVKEIKETAGLVLDEFEKVELIRQQSAKALLEAEQRIVELERTLTPRSWKGAEEYVGALSRLRTERGHLITLKDLRYIDLGRIEELEEGLIERFDKLSQTTVEYLQGGESLAPFHTLLESLESSIREVTKVAEMTPIQESLDETDNGLQLLSQVVGDLKIDDATIRTQLLEGISEVLGGVNRTRALLEGRRKDLRSHESVAEFGAEFKLFSQSVTGQLNLSNSPEDCDTALARMMMQLEDLEARYSDFDEFMAELTTKREEVYEAFTSKKQLLLDQRQRRSQQMTDSAKRILENVSKRSLNFGTQDELNTYFASDTMVSKVRDLAERLRELGDNVKADELEAAVKSTRQEATRSLRDRKDLFEDGKEVLRFGKHRFSVNTQPLDLTLVPRLEEDGSTRMMVHLTGTDFYETIKDEEFADTRPFWSQTMVSELTASGDNPGVYRSEYLAACILQDAEAGRSNLSLERLHKEVAEGPEGLLETVRTLAAERYDEGYERGVHDADAARILERLLSLHANADLLRFTPQARALAALHWAFALDREASETLKRRATSLRRLETSFGKTDQHQAFLEELSQEMSAFRDAQELGFPTASPDQAALYLYEELSRDQIAFLASGDAIDLKDAFSKHLNSTRQERDFLEDLRKLEDLGHQLQLARAGLSGFLRASTPEAQAEADANSSETQARWAALDEAAVIMITEKTLNRKASHASVRTEVTELLGQHSRIQGGKLQLRLDEFLTRMDDFRRNKVPGFRRYQELRHELLERERYRLRISEYMPKVMSSFVRNQLIDQVYLPIIGDNLAKQMGALGDSKRTDLMGLLLLISPPGYGKTTLMEYIANRLGLVFMKINGPALGHSVTSLDPADAPNATSRQEVEKINLAFEMGNNVLLYIDDIQHTSSEFLQKFISLCDGQRRVEGVWNGRTRTYDMRGKKFAVCMAGNPYTESGERFQIPDMLANRADTYNLGDILNGRDDLFALSYIENSLTSNPILAPVAGRDPADIGKMVDMARGKGLQSDQLSHPYSAVELNEIQQVLKRLLRAQDVLLAVNQTYIQSASQDDNYRTEPQFQLQGSYRNMNKLAEKIVPVMNEEELEALLDDHYLGEAQTLTTGAEHNLLKLRELRGVLTDEEQERWQQIKTEFARVKAMGGAEDDPVTRVTGTLGMVSDRLSEIGTQIAAASTHNDANGGEAGQGSISAEGLNPYLDKLQETLTALASVNTDSSQLTQALGAALSRNPGLAHTEGAADAGSARATPIDPAVVDQIGSELASLTGGLDAIHEVLRSGFEAGITTRGSGGGGSGGSVQVVQTLQPGVHGLLDEMANTIDRQLMESLRSVGRWINRTGIEPDQRIEDLFDRTLASFDRLKDLLMALKKIDTEGLIERAEAIQSSGNSPPAAPAP